METEIRTENGIALYAYKNPYLHSFCLNFYVKAGVLYEEENENGITHFWEHIEFRNLNRLHQNELYALLAMHGLSMNAATYKEFVQFKISGAPDRFRTAADIFTKILEPLLIRTCF